MHRLTRCRFHALAALTLGVLTWTSAIATAGQSMAKDGYVLPPESVQICSAVTRIFLSSVASALTAITSSSRASRSSPISR
jgi:hypothetical protein